jgi:hypothetical protein
MGSLVERDQVLLAELRLEASSPKRPQRLMGRGAMFSRASEPEREDRINLRPWPCIRRADTRTDKDERELAGRHVRIRRQNIAGYWDSEDRSHMDCHRGSREGGRRERITAYET